MAYALCAGLSIKVRRPRDVDLAPRNRHEGSRSAHVDSVSTHDDGVGCGQLWRFWNLRRGAARDIPERKIMDSRNEAIPMRINLRVYCGPLSHLAP